jgi:hypothetical protein
MTRFTTAACILAFTAGLVPGAGQMQSERAPGDASADTDPQSDFWRGVPPVFAEHDAMGNSVPGYRTEIRSRWTDTNLFFLFICPYEQLNLKPEPKTQTETNELWKWDVAEVFIGSDFKNIRKYKEFEISPQGEWVDLDIDLDAPHHEDGWKWNSGFQAAARIDAAARTWYGFMRIPYAAVDERPASAGNTFRINLFRSQGARPNHQSIVWQPTHRPSFHVPEVFGKLELVDQKRN